jgi:hypothetical protein
MALATASDVTVRWAKTPDTDTLNLIEVRLDDVERILKRRVPLLLDLAATDPDYLADVVQIEADAVLRLVRNPEGYISETDGNYTYMLRQDLSSGTLDVLPGDWEILGVVQSSFAILVPTVVMPT